VDIIDQIKQAGRKTLTEYEAKALPDCYGIPVVREQLVCKEEQLLDAVRKIGFPIVMKGCTPGRRQCNNRSWESSASYK